MELSYSKEEREEDTTIIVNLGGKKIGSCSYNTLDVDSFIEYEVDNYLEERRDEEESKEDEGRMEIFEREETALQGFAKEIENKELVYIISYFDIDKDYRNNGYGNKLFKVMLKEIGKTILKNDILYLNASPMYDGMNIVNLTKFYEKFGFVVELEQGGNNLMSMTEVSHLLNTPKQKTENSIKQQQ